MVETNIVVHQELDLTEIILTGELTMTEAIDTLQRFQQSQTTRLVLWNISQVKLLSLQGEDGIKNSVALTSLVQPRVGNKTAAVAESDLNYGLTRMYQAYREDQHRNMPFMTFRTRQEAIDWLRADVPE